MIGIELVSFDREHLYQEDFDSGHLEFLEAFGRANDEITFEGVTGLDVIVREFLGIDKDWEKDGEDVEWDYFLLNKDQCVELMKKISQASLKLIGAREYFVDMISSLVNRLDWENEILAITIGDE